jgi:hypothetical protein
MFACVLVLQYCRRAPLHENYLMSQHLRNHVVQHRAHVERYIEYSRHPQHILTHQLQWYKGVQHMLQVQLLQTTAVVPLHMAKALLRKNPFALTDAEVNANNLWVSFIVLPCPQKDGSHI